MSSPPSEGVHAEHLRIPSQDGPMGVHVARPAAPRGAMIVCHQLFGVTADVVAIADRLARLGYLAIAPDFYHRSEAGVALDATDAGRARGFTLLGEVTRATVAADVQAALAWLQDRHPGPVGMVGMSVGGHFAYYAATAFPIPLTIALYPTFLTTTELPLGRPEPTVDLTGGITGRILLVVGDQDHIIPAGQRHLIAARLSAEQVRHEIVTLPGAPHAFLSPGTASHHAQASAATWRHIEHTLTTHGLEEPVDLVARRRPTRVNNPHGHE